VAVALRSITLAAVARVEGVAQGIGAQLEGVAGGRGLGAQRDAQVEGVRILAGPDEPFRQSIDSAAAAKIAVAIIIDTHTAGSSLRARWPCIGVRSPFLFGVALFCGAPLAPGAAR
jgi:hypothetical protein